MSLAIQQPGEQHDSQQETVRRAHRRVLYAAHIAQSGFMDVEDLCELCRTLHFALNDLDALLPRENGDAQNDDKQP